MNETPSCKLGTAAVAYRSGTGLWGGNVQKQQKIKKTITNPKSFQIITSKIHPNSFFVYDFTCALLIVSSEI